jgi:fucose 4-O-acetylase-like acetyltransferase
VQSSDVPHVVWATAGQLAMLVLVGGTLSLGVLGVGKLRRHLDPLATSVIPIVIGYAVAHYLSLLVVEGQRTLINLSDPLGQGWNVFGTAELAINLLWLETPQVTAAIQLVAIVGGHLLGVLVAHELCIRVLPPARRVVGQVPLLLVMIGYTCGGLLLLFSP